MTEPKYEDCQWCEDGMDSTGEDVCTHCGGDGFVSPGGNEPPEPTPEEEMDAGPCMGADCINHEPMHTYRDCFTVEMMRAAMGDD